MRFALLGSGSEGNGLVVQAGGSSILMDCGFTLAETAARLARLGLEAAQLSGIVVTHEHGDHISGVARLARKHDLPVWITHGTLRAHARTLAGLSAITEINPHESFAIGALQVQPYLVPHDAAEPVQYVFGDGSKRLGVLTDAGCSTPHIEATLNGCDALVLECNHDAQMLADGDYPYSLKQRVGGRLGHLSNDAAAALLARLSTGNLQHIVAAHLSSRNNRPELAVRALSGALNCSEEWIAVATQEAGLDWREV
ncbi:MAG: MBL fold metallo-hydrolase [Sideroxydans sp.]|nr:MBL fold metallo-hydrolase [Sideroxydans sp.]